MSEAPNRTDLLAEATYHGLVDLLIAIDNEGLLPLGTARAIVERMALAVEARGAGKKPIT